MRVIFTTDEEIGNGVDGLDVQELGCDYGYTVDGGPLGEIEFENFNAASAVLTVHASASTPQRQELDDQCAERGHGVPRRAARLLPSPSTTEAVRLLPPDEYAG